MTDERLPESPDEESFGIPELDDALAEGLLKGHARMDLALSIAACFLVVTLGLFPYLGAMSLPFVFDDYPRIVENPPLHGVSTISEGWDATELRPAVALSYALDWRLGGGQPGWFHATNVLLHLLAGVALFVLCRGLFRSEVGEAVCLAGAAFFVFQPALADTVNALSMRGTLLGTAFGLLAIAAFLRDRSAGTGSTRGLMVVVIAYAISWASHPAALAIPIFAVAAEFATARRASVRWLRVALFLFLGGAFAVVHRATFGTFDAVTAAWEGLLGDFVAYLVRLSAGYLPGGIDPGLALDTPALQYPIAAAISVGVAAFIAALPKGVLRIAAGAVVAMSLVVGGVSIGARGQLWSNEFALLEEATRGNAKDATLHRRMGDLQLASARAAGSATDAAEGYRRAARQFEQAVELDPEDLSTRIRLGNAQVWLGDSTAAGESFEAVREVQPLHNEACTQLAKLAATRWRVSSEHGDLLEALDLYAVAFRNGGLSPQDSAQFAALLTQIGDFESADAVLAADESDANADLKRQNAQSLEALSGRAARAETQTDREQTYERAHVLHLRTDYQHSNYLLRADLRALGFHEKVWRLLGENMRRLERLESFVQEFADDPAVTQEHWETLSQDFRRSGDAEASRYVLTATDRN